MKSLVAFSLFALLNGVGLSQQSPQPDVDDGVRVDQVLQRYLAAYQHKSLQELTDLWPDLQKNKKEFDKIKHHFADASLTDEQMTVTPLEVRSTSEGAVVRAQRTEKFVKTETSSSLVSGDLMGGSPQSQAVPMNNPVVKINARDIKKSDEVWITMRRAGDQWTIVSISERNPQPSVRPST
jgi:hypothetical protein